MTRAAHGDGADAVRPGALDAELDGALGDDLTEAVVPVEDDDAARVAHRLDLGDGPHRTAADAGEVPGQADRAVRRVPPQLGDEEGVGQQLGVVGRHPVGPGHVGHERGEGAARRGCGRS